MAIRPRVPQDLPAVVRLLEATGLTAQGLERTEGWVLEEAGRILGHVALERTPDAVVLRSLAVDPAQRGRGLARQLLDLAEAQAGPRALLLKTSSIGPWVERRGYRRATRAQVPASALATTQFEGCLCAEYPIYLKPGAR